MPVSGWLTPVETASLVQLASSAEISPTCCCGEKSHGASAVLSAAIFTRGYWCASIRADRWIDDPLPFIQIGNRYVRVSNEKIKLSKNRSFWGILLAYWDGPLISNDTVQNYSYVEIQKFRVFLAKLSRQMVNMLQPVIYCGCLTKLIVLIQWQYEEAFTILYNDGTPRFCEFCQNLENN